MVFFLVTRQFAKIASRDEALRTALGIRPDELLVVYNGIHKPNWREVRSRAAIASSAGAVLRPSW
jgi:hypothetical protein